jgi:replicative superfamily II helicase
MKMVNSNAAITGTFKVVMDTATLAQGYNCTCELMIMK